MSKLITAALILTASISMAREPVAMVDRIAVTEAVTRQRVMKGVTARISQRKESWRFTHNGTALVHVPFFSGGETWTPHQMVECRTITEARNMIATMGLKVSKDQRAELDALEAVPTVKAIDEPIIISR
jgi:hypothetical protein